MKRDELLDILKPVSAFVSGKSGKVVTFQYLCLKGNLALAYNGECGYCVRLPLGVDCTVLADRFLSLIAKQPAGEEIEIAMKGDTLKVKCKGSTAVLQTGDVAQYPDFIPSQYVDIGQPGNLSDGMRICADLIDTSSRNQFPGVAIRGRYAYSTDGLRATRVTLDSDVSGDLIYLPSRSAKSLLKLPAPSKLILWNNMVGALFDNPVGMWCSATLAGRFPANAIDEFFATPPNAQYIGEFPEGVLQAMDRLQVMTDDDSNGIDIVSDSGHLIFAARVREGGELTESFEWDFPANFRIRVNPRHFRHGLTVSRRVDLTQACGAEARQIRFMGEGVDHLMSLTAS